MNPQAMIDQLLSGLGGQAPTQHSQSMQPKGEKGSFQFPGGAGGAAAAAGLAGYLLGNKKGRKMMKSVAKYGGLAALGGLAYKAYQNNQKARELPSAAAPDHAANTIDATAQSAEYAPPSDVRFLPSPSEQDKLGVAVLQAMIAAAKADGHLDQDEQDAVFDAVSNTPLDVDDKAMILAQLRAPLEPRAIAVLATTPEMAMEIYAASAIIIGEPNHDERRYLDRLAGAMNLEPTMQDSIEQEIAQLPVAG